MVFPGMTVSSFTEFFFQETRIDLYFIDSGTLFSLVKVNTLT